MKCFYHEGVDAVATCQRCGKTLCKKCAEKHDPCLCDSCYEIIQNERAQKKQAEENVRKQKYRAALVDTRSEFVRACLYGVIWVVIGLVYGGEKNSFYMFFVPFGWALMTYFQSFFPFMMYTNTISGCIIGLFLSAVKLGISIPVGIPAFIYQAVKTFSAQKKIDQIDGKN